VHDIGEKFKRIIIVHPQNGISKSLKEFLKTIVNIYICIEMQDTLQSEIIRL
jgi:hypothetical protein